MAKLKVTTENSKQNLKYRAYFYSLEIVRFITNLPKVKTAEVMGNC